jgi:hypothetical protein
MWTGATDGVERVTRQRLVERLSAADAGNDAMWTGATDGVERVTRQRLVERLTAADTGDDEAAASRARLERRVTNVDWRDRRGRAGDEAAASRAAFRGRYG